MGYHHLDNTAKTSVGEGFVKICPVVAEKSRQKEKKTNASARHKPAIRGCTPGGGATALDLHLQKALVELMLSFN